MLEGVGSGDGLHLVERESTEGTTGSGEQDLLYLRAVFAYEGLKDSAVLTIHRQDRRMVLLRKGADDLTCYDERLLVRQRNRLTGFDGFDGRTESCVPHHGGYHDIDTRHRHHLSDRVRACPYFNVEC